MEVKEGIDNSGDQPVVVILYPAVKTDAPFDFFNRYWCGRVVGQFQPVSGAFTVFFIQLAYVVRQADTVLSLNPIDDVFFWISCVIALDLLV